MIKRILFMLAVLLGSPVLQAGTITVSAAISLKDVLTVIAPEFEKQTGDHIEFQFGASGLLATQIRQGAPVDLFISAARKQVDDLAKDGIVDPSTTAIIAGNKLVLIVPAAVSQVTGSFEELANAQRFKRIAIGDPKTVPAGDYGMQVLNALKLADAVKDRLIQGVNVRQVLSYVEQGEVDAGVVYKTDALESGNKVKLAAVAEEKLHQPIEYPAAIVSKSKSREAAVKFLNFLKTDFARQKLTERGFTTPSTPR